jgi:cyclophilin family peptidyl-prolyl cis-trans isomerase
LNFQSNAQRVHRRLLPTTLACVVILGLFLSACSTAVNTPAADDEATPAVTEAAATPEPAEETQAEPAQSAAEVPPPDEVSEGAASELEPAARADMYSAAPEMIIDPSKYYYATFKTERGDIKVQLFADRAPITVNNFVFLAREGYYNNTVFHRVLQDFMAQGGDPTGTGMGGPGYTFQDEFDPSLTFDRAGLLAMANSGPATNGSQFFLTFAPTDWLNNRHTIFGEVVEGMDILNQITLRDPEQGADTPGDTLYTVLIEESDVSQLPTPLPPTPTPTPYAPSATDSTDRPLAAVEAAQRFDYFNTAPEMFIDTAKQYTASVQTTQGEFVIELYDDAAPTAVNNFVVLANLGFFDGLPVNANAPDNALIFGSPDNDAQHDVGYQIQAETNLTGTLDIGSVSYIPFQLPTGELAASGSQLLVARIVPPAEANAQFSFFGKVVSGLEVIDLLTTEDTIETVTITESE